MHETAWLGEVVGEDEARRAHAFAVGVPFVLLAKEDIDPAALLLIPEPLCRAHSMAAFAQREGGVQVAMLSTESLPALEFLGEKYKVLPRLTDRESLRRALLLYQKVLKEKYGAALAQAQSGEEALDLLLAHALSQRASAVHLESREHGPLLRYRISGVLHEAMSLPAHIGSGLLEQLKKMGEKFGLEREGEKISIRASILPTAAGPRATLHVARSGIGTKGFTLESLGLHGPALEAMHEALAKRSGLVAISGDIEAGVTTLLYTMLDMLGTPERHLASVEPHIEHRLPMVAQTALDESGLTCAAALRAILRQDPDVVMIGEVSDAEVAALAAAAAAHGALVLAGASDPTIFTTTPGTLVRVALARKLCPHYREERRLLREESAQLEMQVNFGNVLAALKEEGVVDKTLAWRDVIFYTAGACADCNKGYRGKVGIQEMQTKGELQGLTLLEDALFKAAQGLTTLDEVLALL